MTAPLNGFKLIMLLPMFGRGEVSYYIAVVDRGERLEHDRYVVVSTLDPTAPTWSSSIFYTNTLKAAVLKAYDYAEVRVVLNAAHNPTVIPSPIPESGEGFGMLIDLREEKAR